MHGVSNREILHYIVVCVFACVLVCIRLAGAVLVQGSGPGVRPAEQDPEKMDCGFVACTAGSCPTNRDGKSTTHKHTSLRTHTYSNAQEHKTITHMHTDTCAYTYTNTCTQTQTHAHTQTRAYLWRCALSSSLKRSHPVFVPFWLFAFGPRWALGLQSGKKRTSI